MRWSAVCDCCTRLLLPTYKEVIGFRKSAAGSGKSMEEAENVQFHVCGEVIFYIYILEIQLFSSVQYIKLCVFCYILFDKW